MKESADLKLGLLAGANGKELGRSWGYLKSLHDRDRFGATPRFL